MIIRGRSHESFIEGTPELGQHPRRQIAHIMGKRPLASHKLIQSAEPDEPGNLLAPKGNTGTRRK